jgi:hypothetical protein
MRSVLPRIVAGLLVLAVAACAHRRPEVNRKAVDRITVVVLAPNGTGGCKYLSNDHVAFRGDQVIWHVHNFCSTADGKKVRFVFTDGTPFDQGSVLEGDLKGEGQGLQFALLKGRVSEKLSGGVTCASSSLALCFPYKVFVGTDELVDPRLEIDP